MKFFSILLLFCTTLWQGTLVDEDGQRQPAVPALSSSFAIVISLDEQLLRVFDQGVCVYEYAVGFDISSGAVPVGEFRVVSKQVNWQGVEGNYLLHLNVPWGEFGIHGIEEAKSYEVEDHGCFRLSPADGMELWGVIPVGTGVTITGSGGARTVPPINTQSGSASQAIVYLQQDLNARGFWCGPRDGYYGAVTVDAVRYYQALSFLPVTGTFSMETKARLYPE